MHRSGTSSPTRRRRLMLVAAVVCIVPVGLAARFLLGGWVADTAGGVLYAVLVYLLVAFCLPQRGPLIIAVMSLGICWAVELLQLTPLPRDLGAVFPPIRLVLGTTFVAWDLLGYAAGAAAAWLAECCLRVWGRTASAPEPAAEAH
ncbi:DUF2809 domain-containing protein [Arthrobacter sp.]|uniref:ribosomal maturation YjgA family protein n=1 Tax=Arthrobacter sp. TaxID=1667 RepID=UPI003A9221AD